MAFYLYTRNNLESLGAAYSRTRLEATDRFRKGNSVFERESIAVATRGMATWLEHHLVRAGHVVATVDFVFLREAIDTILESYMATQEDAATYQPDAFREESLVWRIYGILTDDAIMAEGVLSRLRVYLETLPAGNESGRFLRVYQLANKLAGVYYDYMSFLPELLSGDAQVGDESAWQFAVWRHLCRDAAGRPLLSPAHAMMRLLNHTGELPGEYSPVTFFGVSTMPPRYLDVLKKLSDRVDVNFFYLNHCNEYWADVQSDWQKHRERKSTDALPSLEEILEKEDALYENSILGNFGVQGRQFFRAVMELDGVLDGDTWDAGDDHQEALDDSEDTPLLRAIQSSVLNCTTPTSTPLQAWDDSFTIHNCFGPLRQVEALQDSLLNLMNCYHRAGRPLAQNDIIVMAPDIGAFAPAIRAVFDRGPFAGKYVISDRSVKTINSVAQAFLEILRVPRGQFEYTTLMSILESPAVWERFGIDADGLARIREWLSAASVRWGRDRAARCRELGIAENNPAAANIPEEYTWRHGLDRLLLHVALDETTLAGERQQFGTLTPLSVNLSTANMALLGGLCQFFDALTTVADTLATGPRPIAAWCDFLEATLRAFFQKKPSEPADYDAALQQIARLRRSAAVCGSLAIPFDVVYEDLSGRLDQISAASPFLNGAITFCSLMPMRGIPCKVIALLGMDDGAFPRQDRRVGFNLVAWRDDDALPAALSKRLTFYDHSRTIEDRFTFLEALMSARDYLMIFYTGRNPMNLNEIQPAVPVVELLDFARRVRSWNADADGDDSRTSFNGIVVRHRLNPVDKQNYRKMTRTRRQGALPYDGSLRRLFSFNAYMADLTKAALSLHDETEPVSSSVFFTLPLPGDFAHYFGRVSGATQSVTLGDLDSFFRDPTKAFLEKRLQLRSKKDEATPEDFEPFEVSDYSRAMIRRTLLPQLAAAGIQLAETGETVDVYAQNQSQLLQYPLPIGGVGQAYVEAELKTAVLTDMTLARGILAQTDRAVSVRISNVQAGLSGDLLDAWMDGVEALTGDMEAEDSPFFSETYDIELSGTCPYVEATDDEGPVQYACLFASGSYSGYHRLPLYFRHLLLCASGVPVTTYYSLTGKDGERHVIRPVDAEVAKQRWRAILSVWLAGKYRPMPTFADLWASLALDSGENDTLRNMINGNTVKTLSDYEQYIRDAVETGKTNKLTKGGRDFIKKILMYSGVGDVYGPLLDEMESTDFYQFVLAMKDMATICLGQGLEEG